MIKLGSEEHKKLFCKHFLDTHLQYEPETILCLKLEAIAQFSAFSKN